MKALYKPKQIILSKRANVFYLEHARLIQDSGRVVYLIASPENENGDAMEQMFNIPEKNTAFILLGKGTSITDSAMRMLSAQNVIVGFVGSGGSPVHAISDMAFLIPQSEYRPTEYMQAWIKVWIDEDKRLAAAKELLRVRVSITIESWNKLNLNFPEQASLRFLDFINKSNSTSELLSAEALFAKSLYASLAHFYKISNFSRNEGESKSSSFVESINSMLDHGNYIAYGFAAAALNVLGISFAMPLLHGKTRRGALVFDVADIFKDAWVMPLAFKLGSAGMKDREFRLELIEFLHEREVLEVCIDTIKKASNISN